MLKVLCYPQCFTLTIVLELYQPSEETGSNTRKNKGWRGWGKNVERCAEFPKF